MKNIILYHSNCYDGFGAAYAAWKHFGDRAEYHSMYYGAQLPLIEKGDNVFLLDYSRGGSELIAMAARGVNVEIHDHHQTAESAVRELTDFCEFASQRYKAILNMDKSGAILAWERFFGDDYTTPPIILQHIQDRDLWKFELEGTKEVHAALCSLPFDFEVWDDIITRCGDGTEDDYGYLWSFIEKGKTILAYHDQLVEKFCENAELTEIGGHQVPLVNISMLFSEVPHRLLELYPDAPFSAYRYFRKGGIVQYGLRGRGDFDVSEVAKKFGGGGHFSAAGYEVKENA